MTGYASQFTSNGPAFSQPIQPIQPTSTHPQNMSDATNTTSSSSGIHILLLHGPNLNLLGTREPETYGYDTLSDVESKARTAAQENGGSLEAFQSNHEGALIDRIHQAKHDGVDAILINAGEYFVPVPCMTSLPDTTCNDPLYWWKCSHYNSQYDT